jgi:hypothetical protein
MSAADLPPDDDLNSSFVAPGRFFKGEKLAPFTEGSRLLCLQLRDEEDSGLWFVWSFLFVHILLARDRPAAIRLAWNRAEFREKVLEFLADKTTEDRETANQIVTAMLDEAAAARVEVIPPSGLQAPPGNA